MGLVSGLVAAKNVQKIVRGGTANLSIADISMLITNLPDAKKNLSCEQFEAIHKLFNEFQTCKTKMPMDAEAYVDTAIKIIKRYDAIAPYELYSGGSEMEFSFMMEEIRKGNFENSNKEQKNKSADVEIELINIANNNKDKFNVEGFVSTIIEENSKLSISELPYNLAKAFCGIVISNKLTDARTALSYFDKLANKIVDSADKRAPFNSMMVVSYFSGLLYSCGIVTKEDSDIIGIVYCSKLNEKTIPMKPAAIVESKLKQIADADTKYKVEDYIKFLIPKLKERYNIEVSYNCLKVLMGLVVLSEHLGKEVALKDFDIYAKNIIEISTSENYQYYKKLLWVLCKLLFDNGAITSEEKQELYEKYSSSLCEKYE